MVIKNTINSSLNRKNEIVTTIELEDLVFVDEIDTIYYGYKGFRNNFSSIFYVIKNTK